MQIREQLLSRASEQAVFYVSCPYLRREVINFKGTGYNRVIPRPRKSGGKFLRGLTMAGLGFAATALPLFLFFRRATRDAPEDVKAQGWPIQLMQILFARYVNRWIDVKGMENLPPGSWLVAANHAFKSGVDGYILAHLLATRAGRIPRIVITTDNRDWVVRVERWVLHHYGVALLVGSKKPDGAGRRQGTSDAIAAFLREGTRHSVLIFPAGRAVADPVKQLEGWSTGAAVAAWKSGCPIVPVAIGGLRLDWTPETVIFAGMEANDSEPPFLMQVRIGKPIVPTGEPQRDTEQLRQAVADLMQLIPGLRPTPDESDPAFGKVTLPDGRTLAYMDRGPRGGIPVLYFHGFQGSRLERTLGVDEILQRLNIRLLSPDRPGIGLSTPQQGRTMAGWSSDVAQLVQQLLGAGQPFSLLGFSAGATYALACGHIPGLRAMALVGSLGLPHLITTWRRYSQETWQILLSAKLANFRSATFLRIEKQQHERIFEHWEKYIDDLRRSLAPDDERILQMPEVEESFRQNRRQSYSQGSGSMLQEVQALYSDPDVDLSRLAACTVQIIHGTDDRTVPVEVARDLHSRIAASTFRELPGRGHYFLYEPAELETVLTDLLQAHRDCPGKKG